MARYKDVEGYRKLFDEEYKKTRKLISEGETHLDNLAEGFSEASRVIDRMPAADVAPKSEVAREVIEFIENKIKAMEDHTPTDELDKAIGLVSWILLGVVDQLKKKYTEEKE